MYQLIVDFIIILFSGSIGFWLGLRSQKDEVKNDISKAVSGIKKPLTKEPNSAIIKAWTPEQFEEERKHKFETENYK